MYLNIATGVAKREIKKQGSSVCRSQFAIKAYGNWVLYSGKKIFSWNLNIIDFLALSRRNKWMNKAALILPFSSLQKHILQGIHHYPPGMVIFIENSCLEISSFLLLTNEVLCVSIKQLLLMTKAIEWILWIWLVVVLNWSSILEALRAWRQKAWKKYLITCAIQLGQILVQGNTRESLTNEIGGKHTL